MYRNSHMGILSCKLVRAILHTGECKLVCAILHTGEIEQSEVDGRAVGQLRVWPGGLAMTRSIGDYEAGDPVIGGCVWACVPVRVYLRLCVARGPCHDAQHRRLRSRRCCHWWVCLGMYACARVLVVVCG